jgi:hypothetical protein
MCVYPSAFVRKCLIWTTLKRGILITPNLSGVVWKGEVLFCLDRTSSCVVKLCVCVCVCVPVVLPCVYCLVSVVRFVRCIAVVSVVLSCVCACVSIKRLADGLTSRILNVNVS